MSEEQKVPTKEEIMGFLQEQIDVKKLQVELQELNTNLAALKAEELKALSFIGQMTNPQAAKEEQPQGTPHTVTQEDLDNNPELVEAGVAVGDDVIIPAQPEESKRSLKKV
jgi:co-chaperonin GroES (HSP10)